MTEAVDDEEPADDVAGVDIAAFVSAERGVQSVEKPSIREGRWDRGQSVPCVLHKAGMQGQKLDPPWGTVQSVHIAFKCNEQNSST